MKILRQLRHVDSQRLREMSRGKSAAIQILWTMRSAARRSAA